MTSQRCRTEEIRIALLRALHAILPAAAYSGACISKTCPSK